MKKLLAATFVAVGLSASIVGTAPFLTGCPGIGLVAPQGFDESVVAGYQAVASASNLVGEALDAGKISPADARNAHEQLTNVKEGIDIAAEMHLTNAPAGEARLKAVLAGLDALDAYLRARIK